VFHETEAFGYKSDNGSWNGMVELVRSGVAHIGVDTLTVSKARSEVVIFTDPLLFIR
jgi:hypothetical protein